MVLATRVLYLLSGVLMLVSGIYVQWRFSETLPNNVRLAAGLATMIYFAFQVYRFLVAECTNNRGSTSEAEPGNFGLDIMQQ